MGILRRVADAVGLREGEGARTGRLFAFIFLITVAFVFAKAAQRGIFLAAYPRSRIPDAFIISALCLAAASFLASALAARLGPSRLILWLLGSVSALFVFARLTLTSDFAGAPMVLYVLVEVSIGLLMVQSWAVVTEVLDVRSAKRLLPIVGNAAGMAWALGGFAVPGLVLLIGTADLLFLAAALFATAAFLVRLLVRKDLGGQAARGARGTTLWAGARGGLRFVRSEAVLRVLAVITVLGLLIELVLDYQILAAAQIYFATEPDRIASFMGTFYGVTGALALLAPITFSVRVLSRFGSARSSLVEPSLVLIGSLAFLAKQALSSPARAQIQTVISPIRRAQAGALLKGVLAPLFYAAGAAALKLLPEDLDIKWLSIASALLTAAAVLVVAQRLRRAYVSALRRSVDQRQLDLGAARERGAAILDDEQISMFVDEVRDDDPDRAAFSVSLLAAADPVRARGPLVEALEHSADKVKCAALRSLAQVGQPEDAVAIAIVLAKGPGGDVERICLRTLAAIGAHDALDEVRARTDDPSAHVRALARACMARALLAHSDREGAVAADLADAEQAIESFRALLASEEEEERAAAARAMGETHLCEPVLDEAFAKLLSDPSLPVRNAAIQAAGNLCHPELITAVVSAFANAETAPAAFGAFAAMGEDMDQMIEPIEQALDDAPDEVVGRVAAALAAGIGPNGDALLSELLAHEHRVIRYRAARALTARSHSTNWQPPPRELVRTAVRDELQTGYGYYALLTGIAQTDGVADFDIEPEYEPIATEIRVRIRQTEQRMFGLLSLTANPRLVRSAWSKLRGGKAKEAASAVELLENALDSDLARLVIPFFEPRPLRLRLREVRGEFPNAESYIDDPLAGLMSLPDQHLKCCAVLVYRDRIAAEYPEVLAEVEPMLPLMQRVQFLRRVPLFSELSGEDLMQVAQIAEQTEFPADHVIFHKDDPGDVLYLIMRGRVSVRDGDREIVALGSKEFFGELAVLDDEPRSASAVCVEDTALLSIAEADLEELMERRPAIAREIIRVLTRRLRTSTKLIADG